MHATRSLAVLATAVVLLTGCTDSDAPAPAASADAGGEDLTPATIGVIPIADTAPLYLGEAQGFFEEEGIDLTIETASGGAAIVPAVVSGDYQFGFSNYLSLTVAVDKGLPLHVVSAASATTGDTSDDFGAVIVKADSPVQSVADLAGLTVSSNSVGNINDTVVRTLIDEAGADSSTTKFVEVPFPDAVAAVENDQVDAAFVVEPFVSAAVAAGNRVVTYAYADFDENLDIAGYFTTNELIEAQPELVEAFSAAMARSLEYAQQNEDEVRTIIGTYTSTPPEALETIVLPSFPSEIDRAAQDKLAQAAQDYGVLSKAPDLDALLP